MTRRGFFASAAAASFAAACTTGTQHERNAEADYPPVGAFLTIDGLQMHYVDIGEGPVVVLVHGANGNVRDWTFSMVDQLKDRYRVIAIDRPGHGYSARPNTGGADPAVQAKLMAKTVEALGADRYMLVGHSYGGAVVTAWALDRPDQVSGMMVLAGATYPWDGDAGLLYSVGSGPLGGAVNALARTVVTGDRAQSMVADVFAPNPMPQGYAGFIGVELALRPNTFLWNARDLDQLNKFLAPQALRYGELAMPMEVIHGDADKTVFLDIHSIPLAATAQNANLTTLRGVGHMPHHTEQSLIIETLERLAARAA